VTGGSLAAGAIGFVAFWQVYRMRVRFSAVLALIFGLGAAAYDMVRRRKAINCEKTVRPWFMNHCPPGKTDTSSLFAVQIAARHKWSQTIDTQCLSRTRKVLCRTLVGEHNGIVKLLTYQIGGSSAGPLPNWRWMEADLISGAELLDQTFPVGRPTASGKHHKWDKLFLRVSSARQDAK